MRDWREHHKDAIKSFLTFLNLTSDKFLLKGGTSLMCCYGLDRFSEDIDLDGKDKNIEKIVAAFCKQFNFSYRTAKDTDTVKRYMINYGNVEKPLKVEVSYRRGNFSDQNVCVINGIRVYNIDSLCLMKANAYAQRDKIRDLYDTAFICNKYYDKLMPSTIFALEQAISYKGIDQFDYLVKTQHDPLIDENKLAESFLMMYDRLGLLSDGQETEKRKEIERNIVSSNDGSEYVR